jgi:ABC-type nitrate/sulfonate/bicarbonate transport system substrate-binding protein
MRPTRNLMLGMLAGAAMLATMSSASAQTRLKVMVFPGLSNFSIFAAEHKNLFAKHGLAVELLNTPNSDVLATASPKATIRSRTRPSTTRWRWSSLPRPRSRS